MTEQAILSPPPASRPSPAASRIFPKPGKLYFGALLPGVGVVRPTELAGWARSFRHVEEEIQGLDINSHEERGYDIH